jgi:hypothetical protein
VAVLGLHPLEHADRSLRGTPVIVTMLVRFVGVWMTGVIVDV